MAFQSIGFGQYPARAAVQYVCLSSDFKTTSGIENGAQLLETDTADRYVFNRTLLKWIKQPWSPEKEQRRIGDALEESVELQKRQLAATQELLAFMQAALS